MAKPTAVTLNKIEQQKVLSKFKGNKKEAPIKDARKISEMIGASRHQVMLFLEKQGLKKYSQGSYC